jgi:AcrR family transcriptional regulator
VAIARARLKQRRQQGSAEEVLGATREVLAEVGVHGLTVALVARKLGVTKQALYHYYPSKLALLLDLCIDELTQAAIVVRDACRAAPDGPSAVEALIRSFVRHHAARLDSFRLVMQHIPTVEQAQVTAADLARIRPINDIMFGVVEEKLAADQRARRIPKRVNPRRLAFSAHLAAIGLLSMKALVERFDDPLRYSDDELVDELCTAFRAAARGGER